MPDPEAAVVENVPSSQKLNRQAAILETQLQLAEKPCEVKLREREFCQGRKKNDDDDDMPSEAVCNAERQQVTNYVSNGGGGNAFCRYGYVQTLTFVFKVR